MATPKIWAEWNGHDSSKRHACHLFCDQKKETEVKFILLFYMNKVIFPILIIISCIPCALASSATITLDSVIDTPDRTIVHDGGTYEITDIGIYRIDQSINASVNVEGVWIVCSRAVAGDRISGQKKKA